MTTLIPYYKLSVHEKQHPIFARLWRFYLTTHPVRQGLLLLWMFYSEGSANFQLATRAGMCKETFEIVSKEVLWSVRGYLIKQYEVTPLLIVTRPSGWLPYTVTPSIDQTLHQLWPCYCSGPYYQIWLLSYSARFPWSICNGCGMPTEDAYSSRHLVLFHFRTCKCSNVETNLSWICLVSGLLSFEHS